jgi:hypothetical protein
MNCIRHITISELGDNRIAVDQHLGVWAAEGIFPMPHFECLRFNAVHECKLHPLPP